MSALILLNLRLSDWAYTGSLIGGQAEAALRSCSKSDEDTYCGNFCRKFGKLRVKETRQTTPSNRNARGPRFAKDLKIGGEHLWVPASRHLMRRLN